MSDRLTIDFLDALASEPHWSYTRRLVIHEFLTEVKLAMAIQSTPHTRPEPPSAETPRNAPQSDADPSQVPSHPPKPKRTAASAFRGEREHVQP
jgi:hypothetical protein